MAEEEKIEMPPAIDGPGKLSIKGQPPMTVRLSRNGKLILGGAALVVVTGIMIGVMTAGSTSPRDASEAVASGPNDADSVGKVAGPQAPSKEQLAQAQAAQPAGNQALGANLQEGGENKGQGQAGGNHAGQAPAPTPAEAHRIWAQKHYYERLQGRILAAEAAETAEFGKASSPAAAGGMPRLAGAQPDADPALAAARRRALDMVAANPAAAQDPSIQALLKTLGTSAPNGAGNGDPAERAQVKNKLFLADGETKNPVYLDERVQSRQGEHELVAGSVIPAVMLSAINSDLPGALSAQVRQTIYDSHDPSVVVIPQGSRLVGRYSSDVAYGQKRVLVAWDSLIFPNGNSISLRGMVGADGQGRSGLSDQVDNHFWKTWGSALLTSMLGVGVQLAQPQNVGSNQTPTAGQTAAGAAMSSLNDASAKVLSKNTGIQPTLEIRPGYTFNVMVNRTLILPAFRSSAW